MSWTLTFLVLPGSGEGVRVRRYRHVKKRWLYEKHGGTRYIEHLLVRIMEKIWSVGIAKLFGRQV